MLLLERVSKSFGRTQAVRDVSISLGRGEVVGLLGPNGAGKSTTIRLITGLFAPDAGRITVAGFDTLVDSLAARQRIGYLPEHVPLYPEMPVRAYLAFRAAAYSLPRRARAAAIDNALQRCDLGSAARTRIGALSKGFRQRVGLAAALLHDPPVLILDEPTTALDPAQVREQRALIRDLAADRTMLISSHILAEVERTCDRVVVMAGGRVRADGPPRALLGHDAPRDCVLEAERAGARGLAEALRAVPGVIGVDVERDAPEEPFVSIRLRLIPGSPDPREAVARAAAERRVLLRELRSDAPSLERAFLRLISQEDGPGAHSPASASDAAKPAPDSGGRP